MYFSFAHLSVEGIASDFHPKGPGSIPGSVLFLFFNFQCVCACDRSSERGSSPRARHERGGEGAAKSGASECTGVDPLSQLAGASMVNI